VLASTGINSHQESVCQSVRSQCSTQTAKRRIMQIMPHNSPGTSVFWCQKSWQNSKGEPPNGGAKCRWGSLNAGAVVTNWRLSTLSIHLICMQHVCRATACRMGLSATADPSF